MNDFDITFCARVLVDCGFAEPMVRKTLTIAFPHDDVDGAIAHAQALSRRPIGEVELVLA